MTSLMRVLEVGGTHVTAATVDTTRQQVLERTRHDLDSAATASTILDALRAAAMTLADTIPSQWAVAMPDPFDYALGVALFRDVGKFDALYGVDVGRALIDSITPTPRSITFAHDTEAFLLGEWLCGAAQGTQRCAAVTIGTGIGSAFLDEGRTVRERPGLPPGGRIHRVRVDGRPLEDVVSRRAIRAGYAARSGVDLDVHEIAALARGGDVVAAGVLDDAFTALGRALAPSMRAFAPEVLVVGGSVAQSWDLLAAPLSAGLRADGACSVEIRPALREADAAVIGAARHALAPRPLGGERPGAATGAVITRELDDPSLVERLAHYYAPDGPACGVNFLDGTEARDESSITGADLFAVANLGLAVTPRNRAPAARRHRRVRTHCAPARRTAAGRRQHARSGFTGHAARHARTARRAAVRDRRRRCAGKCDLCPQTARTVPGARSVGAAAAAPCRPVRAGVLAHVACHPGRAEASRGARRAVRARACTGSRSRCVPVAAIARSCRDCVGY